jgi:NDP-sugar pyrophosphorylase family protein
MEGLSDMKEILILAPDRYGYDFIPPEYLPPGKDEYWLRNKQAKKPEVPPGTESRAWRKLKSQELEILIKNENYCSNWDDFLVTDPFNPALIRNSNFYGLIRLGMLRNVLLKHHDFSVPAGIRNSTVISCDIGSDAAIQDCSYISHYIIGDTTILSRIDEMQTTNHAKFGNGVLRDGENEDVRIQIDIMNEAGGRSVLPFADMLPADAYLWAAYRDDRELTEKLTAITQENYGSPRGLYGTIGSGSVRKSSLIIKDAAIGDCAYIKGANKLKNLTIHSSEDEPTQIGEGVEMVNGIVGCGCHIFYGSKAVRFVIGRNCNLKYGARLVHSVLGDNSTVSCCEILNNLIFPIHEQHHNNSFLIASLIQGMSNMAAGATIGSNHNSRANDGEIRAGRGFWPGLSVTLKHSSRFASFVLIAKGDYPYELNIGLPFSLVNNNVKKDRLEVMPAYFWMYNLYALERNSWKAVNRDKRKIKAQHIETDYLAPDTAEEIISALSLMESWMIEASVVPETGSAEAGAPANALTWPPAAETEDPEYDYNPAADEEIPAAGLERHRRGAVILKPRKAWASYRQMLRYYAVKTVLDYFEALPELSYGDFLREMEKPDPEETAGERAAENPEALSPKGGSLLKPGYRAGEWVNLGGQIIPAFRVDEIRRLIREGRLNSWEAVHGSYKKAAALYPLDKVRHGWGTLSFLYEGQRKEFCPGAEFLIGELKALAETQRWITEQVYISRAKDFNDPFRGITYRNKKEMEQVVGKAGDNFFVTLTQEKLARVEASVKALTERLSEATPSGPGGA